VAAILDVPQVMVRFHSLRAFRVDTGHQIIVMCKLEKRPAYVAFLGRLPAALADKLTVFAPHTLVFGHVEVFKDPGVIVIAEEVMTNASQHIEVRYNLCPWRVVVEVPF